MDNSNDFSSMFSVLPMNQRYILIPGETYEGSITVVNPADAKADFNYKAEITPYSVQGSEYTADLTTATSKSRIIDWIIIENPTGTLAPNEDQQVNFKITVPADAAGGGQYAAITVRSNDENASLEDAGVNNVFEIASVIYAEVEGDVIHDGSILENNIPNFVTTVPIIVSTTLKNDGNVHEDAIVDLKVTNMFTGEVILPTEENNARYNEVIMPGTERYVSREINNLPIVGMVHVEQTVYYLDETSVEETDVFICPVWFMVLIAAIIAAIIAIIVQFVRRRRSKQAQVAV